MPLLRWVWKESAVPQSADDWIRKTSQHERYGLLGPTGNVRMTDTWYTGELGSTCFLTVAPMTAIKLKLVWRLNEGMLFTRTAGGPPVIVKKELNPAAGQQSPLLVNVDLNLENATENFLLPVFTNASGRVLMEREAIPRTFTWMEVLTYFVDHCRRTIGQPFTDLDPYYIRFLRGNRTVLGSNYMMNVLRDLLPDDPVIALSMNLISALPAGMTLAGSVDDVPRNVADVQVAPPIYVAPREPGRAASPKPKAKAKNKAKAKAKETPSPSTRKRPAAALGE